MEFLNQILTLSLSLGSILFNIIVIFSFIERKTSYSQLMRKIMIFECLVLYTRTFSQWNSTQGNTDFFLDILKNLSYIPAYLLFKDDRANYIDLMKRINISLSLSSECILFLLNFFLCYELISSIKYPISQRKTRMRLYDIISLGIIIIILLIHIVNLETKVFPIYIACHFINTILFIGFAVMGILSIIFLLIHFCKEKNETHTARKLFAIKHLLYVMAYLISFAFILGTNTVALVQSGFVFKEFSQRKEKDLLLRIAMYCNCSIGIFLFPIRLLETRLVWNCAGIKRNGVIFFGKETGAYSSDNDNEAISANIGKNNDESPTNQTKSGLLSAYITRNINLEMICCILYGMNKMFRRHSAGSMSSSSSYNINNNTMTIDINTDINVNANTNNKQLNNINNHSINFEEAKAHKIKYKQIFNVNNHIIRNSNTSNSNNYSLKKTFTNRISRHSIDSRLTINNYQDEDCYLLESFDIKDIQILSKDNDAVIIEYYPFIFNILRSEDEITNDMITYSLSPDNNADFFQSLVESKGRSGSFFFFSSDNKFIIKTISASEMKTINQGFLIDYYNHLSNNPDTMIAKIYGIYTIVINEISMIHVILMQNLVNCKSDYVKYIFDLKGSTFQRKTEHYADSTRNPLTPGKDLDFLLMKKVNENLVSLGDDNVSEILNRIEIDVEMLVKNNLMDYSLLMVIIEVPNEGNPDYLDIIGLLGDRRYYSKTFKGKKQKNYLYVLGIIDFLQEYNLHKKVEMKFKSVLYWKERSKVSVQPPEDYAKRFVSFIQDNFQ